MKAKVFISSTYSDLIPYRERVWDTMKNQGVKLLGMEKFGARKSAPLETCLEEVEKCDIYVGIIAYRYGSIHEDTDKSFTQLEYERAVALDKEILIYFLDDEVQFPIKYVDLGEVSIKLEKFKKHLLKYHTIDKFKDPEELSLKLNSKLGELISNFPGKFVRPKRLKAKINRFKVSDKNCIAYVGYHNSSPVEIFAGIEDEELFPVPKSIKKGDIIQVNEKNGKVRYDFFYIDKYGYLNTLGGLSHVFEKKKRDFCKMITSLLKDGIELNTVLKMIDKMDEFDIFEDNNTSEWKQGIKNSLKI